jgi:hypothetical protein
MTEIYVIGGLVLSVFGYIKYLQIKNRGLEAGNLTSKAKEKDAALSQQQKDNQAAIDELNKKKAEADSDQTLADADYWKGKLKK